MTTHSNPEQNAVKMAQAVRAALEHQQTAAYKDYHRMLAIDLFSRYQAYLAAGFNEGQAMQITILYKP